MQDWLMARAHTTPDKVAIYWQNEQTLSSVTFSDLNNKATQETQRLQGLGIRRGQHIALATYNQLNDVVGIFALMRLGCVLVPLNTRLTQAEVAFQCQQADVSALICYDEKQASLYNSIPNCQLITPDKTPDHSIELLNNSVVDLTMPLVIIHTSGTSGKPKGAVLTYNNIYQSAIASSYHIGVMPDDNWLCVLPLFHVGGLSIILRSVLYGTAVTLLQRFEADSVNQLMTETPVTLVSLVPTMLYRLLQTRQHAWHPALRLVLLGGAAPSAELVQTCVKEGIPLATTYGLSEAASQVATSTPAKVVAKPASVGRPLLFTQVRIVDENDKPLPPNHVGEIVVDSPIVMQGYYRNLDATAKALHNGQLYTGDMGYLDEDGDLWMVQRRSDLIVTGGENVYPAEVEAVLRQHPQIEDACVIGLPDAEWGQQVVSAIILKPNALADASTIETFIREHLAGYKVPRQMIFVENFPQTASGKINRPAIKELF